MRNIEDKALVLLVMLVSMALVIVVWPFSGAILWAVIAAVLFAPVNRRLLRLRPAAGNLAAALTLLAIVALVIVPAGILAAYLFEEAANFYNGLQDGEIDFGRFFQSVIDSLPSWVRGLMDRFGLTDLAAINDRLITGLTDSFRMLATQALNIGQSALSFFVGLGVMLYLTFFLLRDGESISRRVIDAIPLHRSHRDALVEKFIMVIRAIVKGSLMVAMAQGAVGGVVLMLLGVQGALLWAVIMAFMSLLPAVGAGVVWVPISIYLLVTGEVWQGVTLILCGIFIISMVDNLLRPVLVGRDVKMPDYAVLISTVGGIAVFGFNGLVIGPMIAALFLVTWTVFTEARRNRTTP
ncbi:MAG: AI-2E family transporter [Sphingomonadaceae bacterium]